MSWVAIPNSDLDTNSPIKERIIKQLRDNLEAYRSGVGGAATINENAIKQLTLNGNIFLTGTIPSDRVSDGVIVASSFANSSIKLGNIKRTTGLYSSLRGTGNSHQVWWILANGIYTIGYTFGTGASQGVGFSLGAYEAEPATTYDPSENPHVAGGSATTFVTWATALTHYIGAGTWTLNLTHHYIQASPPYDLGDGEFPIFIFLKQDKNGKINGMLVQPDPLWANPLHECRRKVNGQRILRFRENKLIKPAEAKRLGIFKEHLHALKNRSYMEIEETPLTKNIFMNAFPHSFGTVSPDEKVLMVEPQSNLAVDIALAHEAGHDVSMLLEHGNFENIKKSNAISPNGVEAVSLSWL